MNSVRTPILGGVLVAAVALAGCAGSSYPQEKRRGLNKLAATTRR